MSCDRGEDVQRIVEGKERRIRVQMYVCACAAVCVRAWWWKIKDEHCNVEAAWMKPSDILIIEQGRGGFSGPNGRGGGGPRGGTYKIVISVVAVI